MRVKWKDFELPSRVVVEAETLTDKYGKFIAEPFERGFGTTVGNSLRRVLLSSIEGAAVTSLRIEGVDHEFSSMDGVLEDVTDIVLNVKGLVVRLHGEEPKTIRIEKRNAGEITGADIQADPTVEIINREHHIATLTKDRDFIAEMTVKKGRGYVPASWDTKGDQIIGVIPLDALFSPVQRVRYSVEDTRVGQRTNYDRLILEIWTNGVVGPEMALVEASKILRKHLNPFVQYFELGQELKRGELAEEELEAERRWREVQEKLSKPITELELSVRATNCLETARITTLAELVVKSDAELLKIKNFGKTSLKEVKEKLKAIGLELGMKIEPPPGRSL